VCRSAKRFSDKIKNVNNTRFKQEPNRKPGFLKNKNRNPTQTGDAKTQTQPKPIFFRKTQP
jgi:hypothetical protein